MPANPNVKPANITLDRQAIQDFESGRGGQTYYGVMHCVTGVISLIPGFPVVTGWTLKGRTPTFNRNAVSNITATGGGHRLGLMRMGVTSREAVSNYCGFSVSKQDSKRMVFRDRSGGLNTNAFNWAAAEAAAQALRDHERHDRDLPVAYSGGILIALKRDLRLSTVSKRAI